MVNKLCFVDGCQTRSNQENGPAAFFRPPKDNFDEWKTIFPEKKLMQTSRFCWKHFDDEDIVKGKMIGEEFYPQERWRLKKGAKPKHLLAKANLPPLTTLSTNPVGKNHLNSRLKTISSILDAPSRSSSTVLSNSKTTHSSSHLVEVMMDHTYYISLDPEMQLPKRSVPSIESNVSLPPASKDVSINSETETRELDLNPNDCLMSHEGTSTDSTLPSPDPIELIGLKPTDVSTDEQSNLAEPSVGFNDSAIDAVAFQALKENVRLPSDSWSWMHNGKTAACMSWFDAPDGSLVIKTLRVLSTKSVSFHVGGKPVLPNVKKSYRDYAEISGFIKTLDGHKVCKGIINSSVVNVTAKCAISKDGDVWRSTYCSYLANSKSELCTGCSKALRYIKKRSVSNKKRGISKKKLVIANQKIRRMKSREMVFASKLKAMQDKCCALEADLRDNSFEAVMKKLSEQNRIIRRFAK
ncbi:uncharacterized protein LOC130685928 isoform X2 [Daphnia carinata]|uniref:uncharacterized protein LOC130685928 isoform X2 n=1 Tax=Daphnia carinata TaxID=120202 RepID=UPI002580A73D|nr:uncharacterized protein LOC130685928 isoform X2 [Daphnia carinata]